MISDAHLDPAKVHDICIVGAGPVGISLALELASLGRDVLLLESGGETRSSDNQSLSTAHIADPARHDDMEIAVSRQFGGTSELWGGRCVPYNPVDFTARSVLPETLWPIELSDLQPHYEQACHYAGCGDAVFEDSAETEVAGAFSYSALERWSNRPRFRKAYRDRLEKSRAIDVRLHSTVAGFILGRGDHLDALEIADRGGQRTPVRARRFVICAGGVETTRLLLTLQRQRPQVLGGLNGPLGRYYMGHLIGEIADFQSSGPIDEALDFYIDRHGSYVRRRFVPSDNLQRSAELGNIAFWPVVPPIADPRHESGPLSLIAIALSALGGGAVLPDAIVKRHIPQGMKVGAHLRNIIRDLPATASFFPAFLWRRYAARMRHPGLYLRNPRHRYGLSYHAEHMPHPESRVSLGDDVDRFGLPIATIDLRFQRREAQWIVKAHDELDRWMRAFGVGKIEYRQPREALVDAVLSQASHGTHQIGLARMASNARLGVVDRDLKAFGLENLFVASSAVLPTSSQANPTLSAIALAIRLAAKLADATSP